MVELQDNTVGAWQWPSGETAPLSRGRWSPALLCLLLLLLTSCATARRAGTKQQSLDEWRTLTSSNAPAPRVFVKGDHVRFFFQTDTNFAGFSANWRRLRVPTAAYRINSAILRLDPKLARAPQEERGWREAKVIAGAEWGRLTTNLVAALTPVEAGHGVYCQGFVADRLWYRDAQGTARFANIGEQPKDIIIDRRYSIDETLENLARAVEHNLAQNHPGQTLFLLMPPNQTRFIQPLLLDRKQRRCVWLLPAALYDPTERGLGLTATAQSLEAFLFEAHGVALLKNPVSSAARLGDLAVATVVRFLRLPLPRNAKPGPPLSDCPGMDLVEWEHWLDRYTGTRLEGGSLRLLLNGEQFFPRLTNAIAHATNHIHVDVYIFDRDDVGVDVANDLKRRSSEIEVKVIPDLMGTIAAGMAPPSTPLPDNFTPPSSIISYLRNDSRVQVRPFLNPWFSADHSKIYLVDGTYAWLGGMNIGREYRYEWHDLMVELQGPVVTSLEDEFRRDWAHAGPLGDLSYFAAVLTSPKRTDGAPATNSWAKVRLLPTKTAWKPFDTGILGAIRHARKYIYVENSYLFDKKVVRGLAVARARGVDVRVVLPRENDLKAGGRGNLVTANYLIQRGVRVFFYPGMTHVKALLADDWACLGSGNLNHLSLRLCQEHNLATSDPAFTAQLKHDLFEEDFEHSYELAEPVSVDWLDFLTDLVLESF